LTNNIWNFVYFPSLQDVLCTILSKLPPKEIVRTSVISNKFKHIWTVCPKLRFDGATMCSEDVPGTQLCTQKFVDNVNAILKQYHGKVVEELDVKFEFDTLAEYFDDGVSFALCSRAKRRALDLLPAKFGLRNDRYRFPLELFDGESISRLQHLQLSFVCFGNDEEYERRTRFKVLDIARRHLDGRTSQLQFAICALPDCLELIRSLPRNTHNYLKNLSITGFAGCTGQVELLEHIVENAPNVEALTIDRVNYFSFDAEYERRSRSKAMDIARRHLEGKTPQNTKVSMM
ncbi:hypothetical protein BAE44_0012747, partial [Dichanthelium oligosanthes]